jgi:hypothetical protein
MDDAWLSSLGYRTLTEPQKRAVLRTAFDALEDAVGAELCRGLTGRQLQEFDRIANMPSGVSTDLAMEWLVTNRPNYSETAKNLLQELEAELRSARKEFEAFAPTWTRESTQSSPSALDEQNASLPTGGPGAEHERLSTIEQDAKDHPISLPADGPETEHNQLPTINQDVIDQPAPDRSSRRRTADSQGSE